MGGLLGDRQVLASRTAVEAPRFSVAAVRSPSLGILACARAKALQKIELEEPIGQRVAVGSSTFF